MTYPEGVLVGEPLDKDLRIIAIDKPPQLLGELFNGVVVDAKGSIRVGSTDIHSNEMGHALAEFVRYIDMSLDEYAPKPLSPERSMILSRVNKSSAAEPESALEKFTTWIYTDPENLDLRVEVLEAVVKVLRESPIAHPATEAEKFPL